MLWFQLVENLINFTAFIVNLFWNLFNDRSNIDVSADYNMACTFRRPASNLRWSSTTSFSNTICRVVQKFLLNSDNEYGRLVVWISSAMETPTTSFVARFRTYLKYTGVETKWMQTCISATLTSELFLLPQQDRRRTVMTNLFNLSDVVRWCYDQRTTDLCIEQVMSILV